MAATHIRQIKSASQRIFLEVFQLLILIAIAGRSLNEHLKVSMVRFGKGDHKLLKRKLAYLYLQISMITILSNKGRILKRQFF